jgi:hypothetical protein
MALAVSRSGPTTLYDLILRRSPSGYGHFGSRIWARFRPRSSRADTRGPPREQKTCPWGPGMRQSSLPELGKLAPSAARAHSSQALE